MVNKKADVVRVYLPPDANTLLSVADHCLRSRNYVNVIVAGKQPALQWLDMEAAIRHCTTGVGIWDWASNDQGGEPDAVMASRWRCSDARNSRGGRSAAAAFSGHPDPLRQCGRLDDAAAVQRTSRTVFPISEFDSIFTADKPMIFAYHGYPWLIHRLTYRRDESRQSARARI